MPQPPHNTVLLFATGEELLLTDSVGEVGQAIEAAYDSKNPFISVEDNFGRTLLLPVHNILMVRQP